MWIIVAMPPDSSTGLNRYASVCSTASCAAILGTTEPSYGVVSQQPASCHWATGSRRQSVVVTGGCQLGVTIVASHSAPTGPDARIVTPVVSVTTGRRSVAPQGMSASA